MVWRQSTTTWAALGNGDQLEGLSKPDGAAALVVLYIKADPNRCAVARAG